MKRSYPASSNGEPRKSSQPISGTQTSAEMRHSSTPGSAGEVSQKSSQTTLGAQTAAPADAKDDAQKELQQVLEQACELITRDYLCELDKAGHYQLCDVDYRTEDLNLTENARFFRLERLVLNDPESFLERLSTMFSVASIVQGSVTAVFHSDGKEKSFYLGVVSKRFRGSNEGPRREAVLKAMSGALEGNLPGSVFTPVEDTQRITSLLSGPAAGAVCSVSGVPALRSDLERRTYLQGLERLDDALRGLRYTIVYIADPVAPEDISRIRQGYEELYSQLSTFAGVQISRSTGVSDTLSESQARSFTKSLSHSLGLTQSTGTTTSTSKSTSIGVSGNIGAGIPGTAYAGIGLSYERGKTTSSGYSSGTSRQEGQGESKSEGSVDSVAHSKGSTEGYTVQSSVENRVVKDLMERINHHLQRLDYCESAGAMEAAAYILAPDQGTAVTVASNYSALFRGRQPGGERAYLNVWSKKADVDRLTNYLVHAAHPLFKRKDGPGELFVSPVTLLHSQEAAQQMFFPQKPMDGITVLHMAPFGRNVLPQNENTLALGELTYLGKPQGKPVCLDLKQLTAHTFITGSTGAGKSNAVYALLNKLCLQRDAGVKFLVIEPAKGEYKNVFGLDDDVRVLGTNPRYAELLRINPFRFPAGVHVLEHIDRLIEIFNVCWPMYAAMPAVLKDAVLGAYEDCGWELTPFSREPEEKIYPTFADVMEKIQQVIETSAYSADTKGDYIGSLVTRVHSLTNGINGQIFTPDELSDEEMFDHNVIIDLSRIQSQETKALIMGILVMRLNEYRMVASPGMNLPLRHLTVLEEAHHLLKRTSGVQNPDAPGIAGKSVEMLANSIAEMRTYGEGFVIVDQSPSALDPAAIRNTNTKIIMRLPDEADRRLAGKSAAMKDSQLDELAKLIKGVAVVYQNDWLEPVLCKIDLVKTDGEEYQYHPSTAPDAGQKAFRADMLRLLLMKYPMPEKTERDIDLVQLRREALTQNIPISVKRRYLRWIEEYEQKGKLELWDKQRLYELSNEVTRLLDCRRQVEHLLEQSADITAIDRQIRLLVEERVGALQSRHMTEVVRWVLWSCCAGQAWKENQAEEPEALNLYRIWVQTIGGETVR